MAVWLQAFMAVCINYVLVKYQSAKNPSLQMLHSFLEIGNDQFSSMLFRSQSAYVVLVIWECICSTVSAVHKRLQDFSIVIMPSSEAQYICMPWPAVFTGHFWRNAHRLTGRFCITIKYHSSGHYPLLCLLVKRQSQSSCEALTSQFLMTLHICCSWNAISETGLLKHIILCT